MLSYLELLLLSLSYLLLLFGVAWWGDRLQESTIRRLKPYIVGLGATIYCSAWSFYGTTAQAVHNGWYFPPTFLGAIVLLIFFAAPLKKLISSAKQGSATSLADYLANHFDHSRALAATVTVICLILLIPYIALQLKAITESFHVLTDDLVHSHYLLDVPLLQDTAFYIALILGLFTIAFGTRQLDAREHHNGLMLAIAFEAIIKITAFVTIAGFAAYVLFDGPQDLALAAAQSDQITKLVQNQNSGQGFWTAVVLGMIAIVCLPRQFHVLVVESESEKDLGTVRWVVPIYLLLFGLCILPITFSGLLSFQHLDISAEQYVLRLPLANDRPDLALLAYLGGLSAGSSMVIVACVAMATMISNELIVPLLLKRGWLSANSSADLTSRLRIIRRVIILLLMLMAYGYYNLFAGNNALGAIGLTSFALVAQFAPALWQTLGRQRYRAGAVLAGIAAGFLLWCYTLLLPMLSRAGWIDPGLLSVGPAGIGWLKPTALLGLSGLAEISHGVIWSLAANLFTLWALSRGQVFGQNDREAPAELAVHQLQTLAQRFLGAEQARLALSQYPDALLPQARASADYVEFVEVLLAGVIGSISARHVIEHAAGAEAPPLLDETTELFHFSRELLQASIDNISQGISVVDKNLRLVAWNRRYLELFDYPQDLVHVGRPVADLLRYNARQLHEADPQQLDEFVARRIAYMADGSPYRVVRPLGRDRVIELRGNPMPGGGFVTTFTDITDYQNTLTALEEHKALLAQKVDERTTELQKANQQLNLAISSKTRFLAAAGHDLIQPLNAAKLFTNALLQEAQSQQSSNATTLQQLDASLHAADNIISELLAIARLDAGAIEPVCQPFAVADLIHPLLADFRLQAANKNLGLSARVGAQVINTDAKLLRRVLQNLLSNALRYTDQGRILVSARGRGSQLLLQVWDTGCGIAEADQAQIFLEFKRLSTKSDGGLGLGLATVERLCRLLAIPLNLRSRPGHGSCFSLQLPLSSQSPRAIGPANTNSAKNTRPFENLQVLCIDNEPAILAAMSQLLTPWGCQVRQASDGRGARAALAESRPDLILADYHLGDGHPDDGERGVALALALQQQAGQAIATIIISADYDQQVKAEAHAAGFYFLKKPVKIPALRALMNRAVKRTF